MRTEPFIAVVKASRGVGLMKGVCTDVYVDAVGSKDREEYRVSGVTETDGFRLLGCSTMSVRKGAKKAVSTRKFAMQRSPQQDRVLARYPRG